MKNVKGAIKWLILTVDKLINEIPLESLGRRRGSCECAIAASVPLARLEEFPRCVAALLI